MAGTWCVRLLALGGLAVALGCRSYPNVPPCSTPLLPGEVVPGPAHEVPGPPIPGSPLPSPGPASPPLGAQLPKPIEVKPGIQPPPQFSKLPEGLFPTTKPPLKPVEPALPPRVDELPPVRPPQDIAPLLTSDPKPPDTVKELPPPSPMPPSSDGFRPGAPISEPAVAVPPAAAPTAPLPPLPLKPGEKLGHAPDFQWLAGVADRHLKGGFWTIRYADIGTDDLWGGKVRLLDDDRLRDLCNGDTVYVEGELMAPTSAAENTVCPPYRVTAVRVIQKAR